jgi:hypothetical protein
LLRQINFLDQKNVKLRATSNLNPLICIGPMTVNSVTLSAFKPSERRKVQRLPAKNINVLIKSLRSQPNSFDFGKVDSVDFNRNGVGFISPHCFSVGDEVDLLIQSRTGTAEVCGVVCNRAKNDNFYRCGIAFKPVSGTASQTLKDLETDQSQTQLNLFN